MTDRDQLDRARSAPSVHVLLQRQNTLANDADIRRMTGGSKPPAAAGMRPVTHTKLGDHRKPGAHTGSANKSSR